MTKLKWILFIVFWLNTIIITYAIPKLDSEEVIKDEDNSNLQLLDYEVNEAQQITSATVKVFDTNENIILNFINPTESSNIEANPENKITDNTINIPSDFHFLLEDSDSDPIGIIQSSSSKDPALLINLFKKNDSIRDIIIKPKIENNEIGIKINSPILNTDDKIFQYDITVESTSVDSNNTAIDLDTQINSLKINESEITSKKTGIALNVDSNSNINFINNKTITGNPAISVNGSNYKLYMLPNSKVKSDSKTESAIVINKNNTYLVNNLDASISATKTAISINADGNNIYNYGYIEGYNPLIVKGKNNKIICTKTNKEQKKEEENSNKIAIESKKNNELTDAQGILVYGELTVNNDSSEIISDFHALGGSKLTINNSSGTIKSDVIKIHDDSFVMLENSGNLYINMESVTNSSSQDSSKDKINIQIFNNKTQVSKIYADETKAPAKFIFKRNTGIRNQGDIYCNINSSKKLSIENELDANIKFIKNTNIEGFISLGDLNIKNQGVMIGDMHIKTNNTKKNIAVVNNNLIVSNFDFQQGGQTDKFIDFSNESNSKPALVVGDINTKNLSISLKNRGGLFLADTIGNNEYKSGISIFNEEHGYWGVIKAGRVFANDIHNKASGYMIVDDICFSKLVNTNRSILQAGTMKLCKKTNGSTKAQINNSSFLFADKITATDEYGIIENSHNNKSGRIITSEITNIKLNNPKDAFIFVAGDLELIKNFDFTPTKSQIALTDNSNYGNIITKNIILKTRIMNAGKIITDVITRGQELTNNLVLLENNAEILCNTIKDIYILNKGTIKITAINERNNENNKFTSNNLINELICDKDNTLKIDVNDANKQATNDKSLQKTINDINKEIKKLPLEIPENINIQLDATTTKNSASIKSINDYFNISGTPQFAGNVCINLTQGAKLILDNNLGVVNNAKLYIRQLNNKSGASKYIPIAKDAISGKLINKNELHLMAGSYLDGYKDFPGSKLIIDVHENLTNFAKDKAKALVNVQQATDLDIYAKIILKIDKSKQNNLPENLEIKVLTSDKITYDTGKNIPKTPIIIEELDKEKNFLHISKVAIESSINSKTNSPPLDADNTKIIANNPTLPQQDESIIVQLANNNDNDDDNENDKDDDNDNNDNSTDDSKKHKKSILETATHKQIQRLISAYLYKNNCTFDCADNPSCLISNSNSIWAKYIFSNLTQLPKNNNSQLDAKLQALVVGIDYKQDSSTIGFATAIANADSTIDKQQQYDSNFNEYIVYFNYKKSEYFINSQYSYAIGKHQLKDSLDTNKYNSYNNSFHIIAGKCLYNYGLQISPNLSLKFSNIIKQQHESITDNQTLVVGSTGYSYIEAGIGAAIEKAWNYQNIITKLYGRFMAYHDIHNSSGYKLHSRELDLAIDVNYQRFSINLEYIYQWEHKFKANSIVATVQYSF